MRTSETINELAAALAAAQGEMQNAAMSAENPHFKSRYADLAAIRNATIPALSKNGLSILQAMSANSTEMLLTTRLMHSSGQWIESAYPIIFNERPHVMGSAITYAKRYSWSAITGIAAEVDDDGNEAQDAAKNGNPLQALPKRKSSAQAKRDNDWPRFEQALVDCQSASEVARLRNEYVRDVYPTWNQDWQDTADQEFNKRLAEFSQGEDLKQTLKDSIEQPEELRDHLIEAIQRMDTETDLLVWKESPDFRRDLASLPTPMQLAVRKAGATKLETLQKAAR